MRGRRDAKDNARDCPKFWVGITGVKNRTGDPLNRFKPHPHESEYFWNRILFYAVRLPAPHKTSQSAHRHQERIILSCRHRIFLKPLFREDILDPTVLVNLCGRQKPRYFLSPLRRFGLHMPTREKIANVNSSVDCWIQINPIHHTEFVPTQVKLTALYGSCFCLWETHVDVALMVSPSRTPGPFFLTPTTPKRLLRRLLGPVHTKKVCVFVFIEKASMNSCSRYRFDTFSTVRTRTFENDRIARCDVSWTLCACYKHKSGCDLFGHRFHFDAFSTVFLH